MRTFEEKTTFILAKNFENFTKIFTYPVLIIFHAGLSVKVAFSVLFFSWQQLQISSKVTFLFASVGF